MNKVYSSSNYPIDVRFEQFVVFVEMQPANRPINVHEFNSDDLCGCPLVHYGREVLKLTVPFACCSCSWMSSTSTDLKVIAKGSGLHKFMQLVMKLEPKTYSELKEILKPFKPWQKRKLPGLALCH